MAFPIVDTPGIIFDTAVARCQEIILGILVMVVVSQVVFPQRVGGMLMGRLTAWLEDARRWTRDVVTEQTAGPEREADRHRLIVNAAALDGLRIHASYDTPELRAAEAGVRRLQRLLQMLLSNVVSVQDRLATLRRDRPDLHDAISPLLADIADWFDEPATARRRWQGGAAGTAGSGRTVGRRHPEGSRRPAAALALRPSCATLIQYWDEIVGLHAAIGRGERISVREEPVSLHRDHLHGRIVRRIRDGGGPALHRLLDRQRVVARLSRRDDGRRGMQPVRDAGRTGAGGGQVHEPADHRHDDRQRLPAVRAAGRSTASPCWWRPWRRSSSRWPPRWRRRFTSRWPCPSC